MKVLFINDSTTYANWGGRGATIALRAMIAECGGSIVKTLFIDDLIDRPLGQAATPSPPAPPRQGQGTLKDRVRPFVPPALLDARRSLAARGRASAAVDPVPGCWSDYPRSVSVVLGPENPWAELLPVFADIDVAVVFGDGDIYGDHALPRTLLFLSFLIKTRFQKPVIMVAHSADFSHPRLLEVAEHVYPLLDDVVFRDEISEERCRAFCRGRFAADTAFWFAPAARETWLPVAGRPTYFDVWPDKAAFDPSAPYLCLGGSSLFDTADGRAIAGGYARLIRRLRSMYSGQLVLTASCAVDQPILHDVARRLDLPLVGVATPVQQAADILGNADAYIGGRFHPSVFALRGGTPVVALSAKSFKMEALNSMAGLPAVTFDSLSLAAEADGIGRLLSAHLGEGRRLRQRLSSWAEDMATSSWGNVSFLKRMRNETVRAEAQARGASSGLRANDDGAVT